MIPSDTAFPEFFAAVAAAGAALTGLLFVAMSVAPRHGSQQAVSVVRQGRAAAALQAFVNTLAVSLFGLVPGTNVGYPAMVLGIGGLLFTAAGVRSVLAGRAGISLWTRQIGLVNLLLLIFGTEFVSGIVLVVSKVSQTALEIIGYALVSSLLVGIARAWELVGDRDTGIFASIALLAGHPMPTPYEVSASSAQPAPGDENGSTDAGPQAGRPDER
jgi:hypothetical protein